MGAPPRHTAGRRDGMRKEPTKADVEVEPAVADPFGFLDSAAFARQKYRIDWLAEGVLAAGQPAVIGGPAKSLKTSLAVDLAVSLGTGTPFLGRFKVPRRRRVAVMAGESGRAGLQALAQRVAKAKGV